MKPSEQAQVNFIADCLRKGEQRKDILAKFVKKWQKAGTRTFDRRLKVAQAAVQEEQKRIRATAEDNVAKEADALKSKIMTSIERQEYLTRVLNGEVKTKQPFVVGGKIMEYPAEPTLAEKLKALAELNKMQGDYAATKSEISVTEKPKIIFPGDEPTDD